MYGSGSACATAVGANANIADAMHTTNVFMFQKPSRGTEKSQPRFKIVTEFHTLGTIVVCGSVEKSVCWPDLGMQGALDLGIRLLLSLEPIMRRSNIAHCVRLCD